MKRNKKKTKQSLQYLNKRLFYIVLTGIVLIVTILYIANLGNQNDAVKDLTIPQKEIAAESDKDVHKASEDKNVKTLTDDMKPTKTDEETGKKETLNKEKTEEEKTVNSKVEPNSSEINQEAKSDSETTNHSEIKQPAKEESKKEEKNAISDKGDQSSSDQSENKKTNNDGATNSQTSQVSDSKSKTQAKEKPVPKAEKTQKQASVSKEKSESEPLSESSSEVQALSSLDPMRLQAEVLRLVNIDREKVGLNGLTMNSTLNNAAMKRAEELQQSFSHARPDGSDFSTVLSQVNITYFAAGENIAMNYPSPEAVVDGWMNSPGHKANILNERFTQLGVGISKNDENTYQWVQIFVGN